MRPLLVSALVAGMSLGLAADGARAGEGAGAWTHRLADAGARYGHVAVAMTDGRVLVAGGLDDTRHGLLASAEIFDPAAGSKSIGNMSTARYKPAATLLPDDSVLVSGGYGGENTVDRYVPVLGRWLPAASMGVSRWGHSATRLHDGRILVTGGSRVEGCCHEITLGSAEIYDPLANRWTPASTMHNPRHSHTATLLTDGRVLVVGGNGGAAGPQLASAEVYDPATDRWTPLTELSTPRVEHTATLLTDGRVLVAGGAADERYWAGSEIYDFRDGAWHPGPDMTVPRAGHTATAFDDGRILVAGGALRWNDALATAEILDLDAGRWDAIASMGVSRYLHTATLLPGGRTVAFVGGWNGTGATGDVALYRG